MFSSIPKLGILFSKLIFVLKPVELLISKMFSNFNFEIVVSNCGSSILKLLLCIEYFVKPQFKCSFSSLIL